MRGKAPVPAPEVGGGGASSSEDQAQGEPEAELNMEFWKSRLEHVLMAMSFFIDPFVLYGELATNREIGSSAMAYYAVTMLVAMPILYMQIFIGQYTQMNCLQYGTMMPLLHGLGISKVLIDFIIVLQDGVNSGVLGHYMYATIKTPWLNCKFTSEECYSFEDLVNCGEDCWGIEKTELSSYLYYRKINETVQWDKILFMLTFFIIAFIIVALGHKYIRYVLSLGVILLVVTTVILILVIILETGPSETMKYVISFAFKTPQGILNGLRRPLLAMNFASAGHITYGTHLPLRISANIQSFIICIIYIFSILIGGIFVDLCEAPIDREFHWAGYRFELTGKEMLFVIIQEFIHIHFKSNKFPLLLNGSYLAVVLSKQIAHLHIIGESIISCFPSLFPFRVYVLSGITVAKIICVIPYYISAEGVEDTMTTVIGLSSLIILELEMISVIYIYNYKVLSDDIHYTVGVQPTRLWKVLWLINPIIITIALASYITYQLKINTPVLILVLVTISPIFIGGSYKLIPLIRNHNSAEFFMTGENWGPRNSKERKLRQMYNPREETHSHRKEEICKHECLLESEVLKNIIKKEEEINMTSKLDSLPTGSHTIIKTSSESSFEESEDRRILDTKFEELKGDKQI